MSESRATDAAGATRPAVSGTRSAAVDANATIAPSAVMAGDWAPPALGAPLGCTLTRTVLPAASSRRYTIGTCDEMPPETRLRAVDTNATNRPSWEIAGWFDGPPAAPPPPAIDTWATRAAVMSRT